MVAMYVGLDVHSKSTVFHAMDADGKQIGRGTVATTKEGLESLFDRLGSPASSFKVALETGTQCMYVAGILTELGATPRVVDAYEVRIKTRRPGQKTDSRDAFEICDGLRRGLYASDVWLPPEAILLLRRLIAERGHFVRLRTTETNSARHKMRVHGLKGPPTLKTEKAWEEMIAREDVGAVTGLREGLERSFKAWKTLNDIVLGLDKEIDRAIEPFREISELLQTMPGVGPVIAAGFIAAIGDPKRFADSGRLASYLGLVPRMHDSGERERRGGIVKRGSKTMRSLLVEGAHHASKDTHPFHPYHARLCVKGGVKKAVVAVAARMARTLWRMWMDGTKFDVEKTGVVHEPAVKKKKVHYRLANEKDRAARTGKAPART